MSVTRIMCEKCGRAQCYCACPKQEAQSSLAQAPGSAVPMRIQGGWTVDFDFLQEIAIAIQDEDEGCSLEMVEAVIIELNKRRCLCIVPPNDKALPQAGAQNWKHRKSKLDI